MRFDRPEIWTLAAVFAIARLVLAFDLQVSLLN